mgnify:CR=1 FL=1
MMIYINKGKLIMRKKEISMIMLAGGASSRMGRDKSDLTIDGKTFLEMQIEKGEKLGISDKTISKWERGNGFPEVSLLLPLCNELDITVNELLSGESF